MVVSLARRKKMRTTARPSTTRGAEGGEDANSAPAGSGVQGSVPEDVALAVLLRAVASRIDPTGSLYMRLCASFQLSSASTLEEGNGSLSPGHWSQGERAWVDEADASPSERRTSPPARPRTVRARQVH